MAADVVRILRAALTSPRKNAVKKFIVWCLEKFVTEDNLKYAIDNDLDILRLTLNHFTLGHNRITPLFKMVLKAYWTEAEEYLTDVSKVVQTLSKNAGCASLLSSERGINYLNRCCASTYNDLYDFVWLDKPIP